MQENTASEEVTSDGIYISERKAETGKRVVLLSLLGLGLLAVVVAAYMLLTSTSVIDQSPAISEPIFKTYRVTEDTVYFNEAPIAGADAGSFIAIGSLSVDSGNTAFDNRAFYVDGIPTERVEDGTFELKKLASKAPGSITYTYLRRGADVYAFAPYTFEGGPNPWLEAVDIDFASIEVLQPVLTSMSVSPATTWYASDKNGVYYVDQGEHALLEGARAADFQLVQHPELELLSASGDSVYYLDKRLKGIDVARLKVYKNSNGAVVISDDDSAWVRCVYKIIYSVREVSLSEVDSYPEYCLGQD